MTRDAAIKTIAIIGGGVSGALTAYHLMQQDVPARVIVIDPRPEFGLGLAYSTPSPRHLLNVPAGKISALPQEPDHFLNWLRANHDAEAAPDAFVPRAVFGRYIRSIFAKATGVERECASVIDYRPIDSGAVLKLDVGHDLRVDLAVLATGNFDPAALPGIGEEVKTSGAYCHNAWASKTYDGLDPDAPVTLIGTGLTGVDVALRLRELGHRGVITAVSRHGIFPNRHTTYTPTAESAIPKETPAVCLAYLRALRSAIRGGVEWRAAVDSLRATTNDLWLALPLKEQQRFRRHLQRRWDVARHRMAPPIADFIDAELEAGTLVIRKGRLAAIDSDESGAAVTLRTSKGIESFSTARVINCTGPSMNYRRVASPLLQSLFAQGLVSAGPLGEGFRCAGNGAMVDADGYGSNTLFNVGPGRLGTLLESIAVPEIRYQAVQLAAVLAEKLKEMEDEDALQMRLMDMQSTGALLEASMA
jgi:uncharacterized NAD(P)/FAD-binding protein YdhS